ncbi:MAG: helix-turn-helix domain-containing protein [Planctomycetota bacterium]
MRFELEIHERLVEVVGDLRTDELAAIGGVSRDLVELYMAGSTPSIGFVTRVALRLGVSLDWLLTGKGERLLEDRSGRLLESVPMHELLAELAQRFDTLDTRISRAETIVRDLREESDVEQPAPPTIHIVDPARRRAAKRTSAEG